MDSQVIEKGFERVQRHFELIQEEFAKNQKEFAESKKESERKAEESKKEIEKIWQDIRKMQRETSIQIKEGDKKFDKYFGKIKELDRNWGKLVEALVRPSVAYQFKKRRIPIIGSGQRVEMIRESKTIEIDILLRDENSVIAVEVKTTLSVADVDDHIEKHLKPFKWFFPEFENKKLYGAVAYIHVEENADRYAYKNGLFVLSFDSKDMVKIKMI